MISGWNEASTTRKHVNRADASVSNTFPFYGAELSIAGGNKLGIPSLIE